MAVIWHRIAPDGRIAVIGSEPQICFYSHRRPATGFIYMYPLTEAQPRAVAMQEQMLGEVEKARPEYAVLVNLASSWAEQPDPDMSILDGFNGQLREQFQLAAWVKVYPDGRTEFQGTAPAGFAVPPTEKCLVYVYRRK